MEKASYRDTIAHLNDLFPGRASITAQEVAQVLDCDIKTVYSSMRRAKDPLPTKNVTKKKVIIPIVAFARWLS